MTTVTTTLEEQVDSLYDVAIGIEDLSFDQEGSLWSVSEAGSRRWAKWSQTFPVIFRIDVAQLK